MDEHTPHDPDGALSPDHDADLPADTEQNGPVPELLAAAAAEVLAEAMPGGSDHAEAALAAMGVEAEGVEAGQILGLVVATIVSIVALSTVLIFLFYMPARTGSIEAAEGTVQYPELTQTRADGIAKISQFARADSLYTQPIESAMKAVVAAYGGKTDAVYQTLFDQPITRQRFNESSINRGMGSAVQTAASAPAVQDSSAVAVPAVPTSVVPAAPPVPTAPPLESDETPS